MSNLEIITRGLCVIGKIDSITERTYKDKNDVEQKSRNIKVIYEGGSIQLWTNQEPLLEKWQTWILPVGSRVVKAKDSDQIFTFFHLKNELESFYPLDSKK